MKLILSVEPVRFPLTGIGRYTYELALRLQQNPEITDLQFFPVDDFYLQLPTASDTSGSGYGLKRAVQKNFLAVEAYRLLMPLLRKQALKVMAIFFTIAPIIICRRLPGAVSRPFTTFLLLRGPTAIRRNLCAICRRSSRRH
jgi:hypothetical protein